MNEDLVSELTAIRKRLIYMICGFMLVFASLFYFKTHLFNLLANPLLFYLPAGSKLIATDIMAPFFVPLKLTVITAVFLSMPNTIFQVWQYIAPGLYRHERNKLLFMIVASCLLFLCGVLFCYYLILPILFTFISSVSTEQIAMFTDISRYLDFILTLFLVFGISFQLPILILALIYTGIISTKKMRSLRPYICVGCFIVAAIVTPPDIFSQTVLAASLYILYELGILVSYIFHKTKH